MVDNDSFVNERRATRLFTPEFFFSLHRIEGDIAYCTTSWDAQIPYRASGHSQLVHAARRQICSRLGTLLQDERSEGSRVWYDERSLRNTPMSPIVGLLAHLAKARSAWGPSRSVACSETGQDRQIRVWMIIPMRQTRWGPHRA